MKRDATENFLWERAKEERSAEIAFRNLYRESHPELFAEARENYRKYQKKYMTLLFRLRKQRFETQKMGAK